MAPVVPDTTTTTLFEAPTDYPVFVSEAITAPREVVKVFEAVEQAEGAGATVRRSIGTPQLRNFSPFLLLDHFNVGPGAGFPDHPHRYVPLPCSTLSLSSEISKKEKERKRNK